MRKSNRPAISVPPGGLDAVMRIQMERMRSSLPTSAHGARPASGREFQKLARAAECVDRSPARGTCNHVCVMLHLRSLYVSKAAILTIPMPQSVGRKSKSRLNSKGLDR
jgi:hypothetical protein